MTETNTSSSSSSSPTDDPRVSELTKFVFSYVTETGTLQTVIRTVRKADIPKIIELVRDHEVY